MDRADLDKASQLSTEDGIIERVLEILNTGGAITAMTVVRPPQPGVPGLSNPRVDVSTTGIEYPPGMVDSIKQQFAARRDQIKAELTRMGVTGA